MGWNEEINGKYDLVAKKTGLTKEEVKTLCQAMDGTWDQIAGDWLEACGIGYASGKTIPRSHVVEAVVDADRLETFNPKDRDVIRKYYALDVKKRKLIDALAFPFARYGY